MIKTPNFISSNAHISLRKHILLIFCIFVFFTKLFLACEYANAGTTTSNGLFIAADVAYIDYAAHLNSMPKPNNETLLYFSRIENFTITLNQNGDFYEIEFMPKLHEKYIIAGGGGKYLINKKNFSIHERIFYK
jgi:hypothetical protein